MRLSVLLADEDIAEEPRILSFADHADSVPAQASVSVHNRARTEHRNRSCAICNRATVEPVELRNGRLGRNGRIVPGTGTLVGFSCRTCGHEWPV